MIKGKIVIVITDNTDPLVEFEGILDGIDLQSARLAMFQQYHLSYVLKARELEIKNVEQAKLVIQARKVQAEKDAEIKAKKVSDALAIAEAKKIEIEDQARTKILAANKKLEQERVDKANHK